MILSTLLMAFACDGGTVATETPKTVSVPAVERIVVLGASVSDGFGLETDTGAKTSFADIVTATLKTEHQPVQALANALFFFTPDKSAKQMIEAAQAQSPTLVVAVDYLFWFGYGDVASESDRSALLERGLKTLDAFECPVLVGDFPDMSLAAGDGGRASVLRKAQVPKPETLEALNKRVRAWAAQSGKRVVVPVAELMRKLRDDEEFAVRGNFWYRGSLPFLLQKDRLHPTLDGSIAVWLFALDALVRAQPEIAASAFTWDAKAIQRAVYAARAGDRDVILQKKLEELRRQLPPPAPVEEEKVKRRP